MGQDIIKCSGVCSFAPFSQAAEKAVLHLCFFERNGLTHAGLGKLISGGVGLSSLINACSQKAFSHHFMLHLYSAHCDILVPNFAGLFSSSSAIDTNGCRDSSCRSCPQSRDRSLSYWRCFGSKAPGAKDSTTFWWRSSVGWMPTKI